jgi:hypothetical protein
MKTGEIENCEEFKVGSGVDMVSLRPSRYRQRQIYRMSYVYVKEYYFAVRPTRPDLSLPRGRPFTLVGPMAGPDAQINDKQNTCARLERSEQRGT